MAIPFPLTSEQPAFWERKALGDCFHVKSTLSPVETTLAPGTLYLEVQGLRENRTLNVRMLDEEETLVVSGMRAALVPKGVLHPQIMLVLLKNESLQKSLIYTLEQHTTRSVMGMALSDLRKVELAIPDPATQDMMVEAHAKSSAHMRDFAQNLMRQAELLKKIADALEVEVLKGKMDTREAMLQMAQVMEPVLRTHATAEPAAEAMSAVAGRRKASP